MTLKSTIQFVAREYALSLVFILLLLGVWESLVRVLGVADYILCRRM